MKDKISALMDGELDEKSAAEMIDWLHSDGQALQAWRAYHLISDAMRDSCMLSDGFAARVAARLSAEPALLAPARLQAEPRKWLVLSAAASVAAVSLVGWVAFAPQRDAGPLQAQVAQVPAAGAPRLREARATSPPAATSTSSECWTACRARSCVRATASAATCRRAGWSRSIAAPPSAISLRCCPSR